MKLASVTAFFPCYNDAGTIPTMILRALQTLPQITSDYEVVVINDGSRDDSARILEEMACAFPQLHVIHRDQPSGYGGVLRAGFAAACKDWIFYTDGDAQYDPREMRRLFEALTPEIDFVNGYKIGRSDPLHRVVIGRLYHWLVRLAFRLRLRDVDCDFRLMRRAVFDRVRLSRSSGVICVELMKKVQDNGFAIAQVPVHHFHRTYGKSQFFNLRRVARTLVDLAQLWIELVVRREHLRGLSSPSTPQGEGR